MKGPSGICRTGSYEDASRWFSTAVEHVLRESGVWGVHELARRHVVNTYSVKTNESC